MKHALCLVLALMGSGAFGAEEERSHVDEWLDLPLEQLLKIKVTMPAAITRFSLAEIPASVTLITAEDIAGSSARNIYDLLEIYVPGASWMSHEKGPHPSMRGLISNHKYLLLVNGRVLNNKAHYGAKSELEMWDLGDIRRIEVIRGPGSVTYGPGAIAGVIHIVTFDGSSRIGPHLAATAVAPYRSTGLAYSQASNTPDFSWYSYASVRQSEGVKPRQFAINADNETIYNDQPLDYFSDFEEPQIKLHWDMNWGAAWRLWVRYTQQGSPWSNNETKTPVGDRYINQQSTRDRQATVSLEHLVALNPELDWKTAVSFDSMDAEGRKDRLDDPDPDNALNFRVNFAEHELLLNSRLNWRPTAGSEYALGIEYARDYFGAGWGDDKRELRLGEDGNIVSGENSAAILPGNRGSADRNDNAFYVGNGWEATTYSLFSEANYEWARGQRILLSARADRNTYTSWLLSPRLALVSQLTDRSLLKLIVQRSVRMNTAAQIYTEAASGSDSTNERLDNIEIIYGAYPQDTIAWQISAFRNHIRVIGFNSAANLTRPIGTLDLYGVEGELSYRTAGLSFGANYSYVKQLNWNLADGETASSISYADYNQSIKGPIQTGAGNDLNNWPNHAAKIFGRTAVSSTVTLQGDARVSWHWQGARDGLSALARALDGDPEQEKTQATIAKLEDKGVYGPEYRLDMSAAWQLVPGLKLTLFVQNLVDFSANKRYAFDSGNNDKVPRKVRFIEEPRLVGLKADWDI